MNRLSVFAFALLAGASSFAAPFARATEPLAEQDARHAPPQSAVTPEKSEPPAAIGSQPLSTAKLPEFATLDVDRDASISREEARGHAGLAAIFNECDIDRDGRLSTWEFAEARQKLVAQSRPDGNGQS